MVLVYGVGVWTAELYTSVHVYKDIFNIFVCLYVAQGAGAIDPQPSEGDVLSFLTEKGLTPPQWAAK